MQKILEMHTQSKATLILEDGSRFEGFSFGAPVGSGGEVVFNTAMTGYPESLTDPSYEGQILITTYPLLGNYGVPAKAGAPSSSLDPHFESSRIHCAGIVCQDYSYRVSHYLAGRTLSEWLGEEGIPGLTGIDTRALTKLLREKGSMLGKIVMDGESAEGDFYDPNQENLIAKVSTREIRRFGSGSKKVVLVDCGTKYNIIRCLVQRGVEVTVVPWDYDFTTLPWDGLFISNGPGNPDLADATVEHLRKAFAIHKPICGICMGNQLLGKAAGARIFKLKYGHRGHNQPVRQQGTDRCFITSQNHGFAIDQNTLPSDWEPLFVNMNDGTNEGIRHKSLPFFSAQFHPEASSGPKDTEFIFDDFIAML